MDDTLQALGDLARNWRQTFSLPLVGITGSNGKTTTKEMLAGILESSGPTLKNPGNLNNLIGLPLTLLGLGPEHRFAVLEMGMNRSGEIRRLSAIAGPTVGFDYQYRSGPSGGVGVPGGHHPGQRGAFRSAGPGRLGGYQSGRSPDSGIIHPLQ